MRRHLQATLVLLLTGGLLTLFLRNADLAKTWDAILRARLDLIAVAMMLTVIAQLIRIERWRRLLNTIGGASFRNTGRAMIIGFSVNALVPGRVGEVLRPYLVAKREGLSLSSSIATVVLERLLDLLAIVMGVAVCLVLFETSTPDVQSLTLIRTGAITTGVMALAGFVMLVVLVHRPDMVQRITVRMASLTHGESGGLFAGFVQRFLAGLELLRQPSQLLTAWLLSLLVWSFLACSLWVTSVAFGIDINFAEGVVLTGMTTIGVSIPTPAGVGGYHAAYELGATALYGGATAAAVAAALVTHIIAFGPITLLGLVFMAHEGLRLTKLSELRVKDVWSTPEGGPG